MRPRTEGQNWAPSGLDGGTPGAVNSTHTADAAPFILKTKHRPKIPASTQLVTVSAEVMYDPANGTNYEFVELRNLSTSKILDLTGVRFTEGIDFIFPAMSLAPGGYAIVVRNLAAFRSVYGAAPVVAGVYGGRLDNSGESVTLSVPIPYPSAIQRFHYEPFWFAAADGLGASLEISTPVSGAAARPLWNEKSLWQASTAIGGTPSGLNAVSNFATWMSAYGLAGAPPGADADADGLDNLSEYALGLVPTVPDALAGMVTADLDSSGHLEAVFTLPFNSPPAVTYTVQAGASLAAGSWTAIATRTGNNPWAGVGTVTTGAPTGGRVPIVVVDPLTAPPTTRRFLRLRFALP